MTEEKNNEIQEQEKKEDILAGGDETSLPKKARLRAQRSAQGKKGKGKKQANLKKIKRGKAYVKATYNNTIVSFTDPNGNVISWCSAGVVGFKGPKKATPYAAGVIVKEAADVAKERGLEEVSVYVKGVGMGREAAIRAISTNGINISSIKDTTPIPHNGCRPKKVRRV